MVRRAWVGANRRILRWSRTAMTFAKSITPNPARTVSLPSGAELPVMVPSLNWPSSFLLQHRPPPVVISTPVYDLQSTDVLRSSGGRPTRRVAIASSETGATNGPVIQSDQHSATRQATVLVLQA